MLASVGHVSIIKGIGDLFVEEVGQGVGMYNLITS